MIQRKQLTPQFLRVQERIAKIADIKAHSDDCPHCKGRGVINSLAHQMIMPICYNCSWCNGTGTTTNPIPKDVKYITVSVSTEASRKRDKTAALNRKIKRLFPD